MIEILLNQAENTFNLRKFARNTFVSFHWNLNTEATVCFESKAWHDLAQFSVGGKVSTNNNQHIPNPFQNAANSWN